MVQAHTLRIGNLYFYAQNVNMPKMFKTRERIEVPIDGGDNKWYYGSMHLRTFSCTLTLYGNVATNRKKLESIVNKVVPVVSPYIGSFNAMVELDGTIIDGTPNVLKLKVDIQESG
jgi:hypothetical protein